MSMKKLLTLIMFIGTFSVMAQQPQMVKWHFSITPLSKTATYTIKAKANIEAGWHLFTTTPGGDGLLIPTALTLDNIEKVEVQGETTNTGSVITKEMEGMGVVNYFEKEATYELTFKNKGEKRITGNVYFQLCNDKMCLPPTEVKFDLNLEDKN